MVRQDTAKRIDHLVTFGRDLEPGPHQVDLGRGLAESSILEHMDPGRQGENRTLFGVSPGEVDKEERVAIPDEEPRAVVVGRAKSGEERPDGIGRAGDGRLPRPIRWAAKRSASCAFSTPPSVQ